VKLKRGNSVGGELQSGERRVKKKILFPGSSKRVMGRFKGWYPE